MLAEREIALLLKPSTKITDPLSRLIRMGRLDNNCNIKNHRLSPVLPQAHIEAANAENIIYGLLNS
jgi:hypothetical protein